MDARFNLFAIMRGIIVLFAILAGIFSSQAQASTVEAGDIFTLQVPENNRFDYVDVPKPNILIKRGSVATVKGLNQRKVVVKEVIREDGQVRLLLAATDGKKFFRHYRTLPASWPEAVNYGELKPLK